MMHIDDFIEEICLGELTNLFVNLKGQVEISDLDKARLVTFVNQGLRQLASRFSLNQKELVVRCLPHVTLYKLAKDFSVVHGCGPIRYIDDTCHMPFEGDLVKILEVRNELGEQLPLNDLNRVSSLFTPSWDTLQIPHPVEGQAVYVIYQAQPIRIGLDGCGNQEFNLPPILESALQSFVAGKYFRHIGGAANIELSIGLMADFESRCLESTAQDMTAESSVTSHTKAEARGFV